MTNMTVANVKQLHSNHWYSLDGLPQHTVIGKSTGNPRPTTIADARKNGWLPSVTTILKSLEKPALTAWKVEQAVLTVMTAPRNSGETDDAFVQRVLQQERQHEDVAKQAADLGTILHDQMERALLGVGWDEEKYGAYLLPALEAVKPLGEIISAERVVVSQHGFAGTMDALFKSEGWITVFDYKTTKSVPQKESWLEHRLQTSAYASTLTEGDKLIRTANLYISTVDIGRCVIHIQDDWIRTFEEGFLPLVKYWSWANNFRLGNQ